MKLISVRIVALVVVLLSGLQLWGQNASNPIQVALLRWYQANTVAAFATCPATNGIAFDGAHVRVACAGSGGVPSEVIEFNSSDGAIVRTVTTGISDPYDVLYDGANIWVANGDDGTVTKLFASSGAVVGTYSVGGPSAAAGEVVFDGKFVWVSNQTPSTVTKLLASTGAIVGVFQLGPSTNTSFGVAFDGANIWVGYGQGSSLPAAGVYKL